MTGVPVPQPAATVLLLRDRPGGSFDAFMVQRSLKSSFMPGAFVFPGGKVDPGDYGGSWDLSEVEAAQKFREVLSGEAALATLAAAVREVNEEAGVALPKLEPMVVFSHWITPEIESRRFDTWFLVARMPPDAQPIHDEFETVNSRWVEPRAALARYGDGDLLLAPPTYYTLWDLSRFDSVDAVLRHSARREVVAVQPRFKELDGRFTILLPGDPLYPSDAPVEGGTRIVMGEGGCWWVVGTEPGA